MAQTLTLTAANSIYMLSVPGVFPTPTRLQGYSADAAFEMDATEGAEVVIGVDALVSAGWVPTIKQHTISLQADSPTAFLFEEWIEAMDNIQEIIFCDAVVTLPGIQRRYQCERGTLRSYTKMPAVRRIVQPRPFVIAWRKVIPQPLV